MRSPFNYLMQAFDSAKRDQSSRNSAETRQQRKLTRQTSYETMEPRRLLAGIGFVAETSQVIIGGTQQPDSATVQQKGDQLIVTQTGFETRTFQAAGVRSILFVGLGGDDYFRNFTGKPSFAYGHSGEDTLIGGFGNDTLVGNSQNDTIAGNGGDDILVAGVGDDRVSGGGGNDRILGVSGTNFLNGNDGNDTIYGGFNRDNITGGEGDDLLAGSEGDDNILANDGADLIFGGAGNDRVLGGRGSDRVYGQSGNDTILGGLGEDFLAGNDGDDRFTGEFGNDRIFGGQGDDRANFTGLISDYLVNFNGDDASVRDQRGFNGDATDHLNGINQLVFSNAFQNAGAAPVFTGPQPEQPVDPDAPVVSDDEIVTIQPIIVSDDDGSNTAEFFGNAEQEADVKERVDAIYALAGIDVLWLPAVTWDNSFANTGTATDDNDDGGGPGGPGGPGAPGGEERPGEDLDAIVTQGDDAGVGSTDPNVIDMYFVELVPAFSDLGENTANGLAFLGLPGVAIQIGDNLVDTAGGRNVIAEVTAHEIGHNLGLEHLEVAGNLMAPGGFDDGGSALTDDQITIAINSPLSI